MVKGTESCDHTTVISFWRFRWSIQQTYLGRKCNSVRGSEGWCRREGCKKAHDNSGLATIALFKRPNRKCWKSRVPAEPTWYKTFKSPFVSRWMDPKSPPKVHHSIAFYYFCCWRPFRCSTASLFIIFFLHLFVYEFYFPLSLFFLLLFRFLSFSLGFLLLSICCILFGR